MSRLNAGTLWPSFIDVVSVEGCGLNSLWSEFIDELCSFLPLARHRFAPIQALHLAVKHATGRDVLRFDRHQVELAQPAAHAVEESIRLAHAGTVDGIADGAGIGKEGQLHAPHDVLGEGGGGLLTEAVVLLGQDQLGDRMQLGSAVVGEVDVVGHP
jgi:hypothetical protein